MTTYISGRPSIHLKDILTKGKANNCIFPLNQKKNYYFFSARYALAAGIKALGISSGDKVLLPAYNCGVEIDPFRHFGIETEFYKIDRSLQVDLDDLLQRIDGRVKAILITHFLGFPQALDETKKICTENKLYLIEDCAHALLSMHKDAFLGSQGDIAIFSLLKTLPVPNGGILRINNRDIAWQDESKNPSYFPTFFYAAELLKNRTCLNNNSYGEKVNKFLYTGFYNTLSIIRMFLAGFRKYVHPSGLYLVRPDSYIFNENICSWGMSAISKEILSQTDFEKVKDIRRENFQYLLEYFLEHERGNLPFRSLPPGVCPLFFPIILGSKEKRGKIYKTLKSRGVITHPWWDRFHPEVPWEDFPDAVYLKERLFGLPIHQDLTFEHLDHVIDEFERVYKSV